MAAQKAIEPKQSVDALGTAAPQNGTGQSSERGQPAESTLGAAKAKRAAGRIATRTWHLAAELHYAADRLDALAADVEVSGSEPGGGVKS